MGSARRHVPVKLIASLLTGQTARLDSVLGGLEARLGPIDFQTEWLPFDHTDYYTPEFGAGLQRRIVTFQNLVDAGELPSIKLQTNELEWALAPGGQRWVNLDPGYVSLGKLVLASTKDHAHRLYLSRGIYGEVTLTFQQGRFQPWAWTYPDYASDLYCAIFDGIRGRYKAQLRARSVSAP